MKEFILTNHVKERIIERGIPNPNHIKLDTAKGRCKKYIKKQCPLNGYKTNNEIVYWREDKKRLSKFSVFVCEVIGISKYKVITAFKINYEN